MNGFSGFIGFMGLTLKDYITFALTVISLIVGFSGFGLGIYNAWRANDKDKVKIKLVPKHASSIPPGQNLLAFDITNMSAFPVTIIEVGLLHYCSDRRSCIVCPQTMDGGSFPRRLDSRTTFSAYVNVEDLDPGSFATVRCAYARTACGISIEGDSAALQDMTSIALEIANGDDNR